MFCTSFRETTAPVWYWSQMPAFWKPSPLVLVPSVLPRIWLPLSSDEVDVPIRKIPYSALATRLFWNVLFEFGESAAAMPASRPAAAARAIPCSLSEIGASRERTGAVVDTDVPPE